MPLINGPVVLHHGDCLQAMKAMADNSVDVIVTDPPYNVVNRPCRSLRKSVYLDKGTADSAEIDIPNLVAEFTRLTTNSIYVWCSTEQVSAWRAEFVFAGLTTRQCVWVKSNPAPINGDKLWLSGVELCVYARKPKAYFNEFCKVPFWRGPSQRVPGFPTPKPVWLMRELVRASVPPGGIVLDPFMGSGTTGIAALMEGFRFIGIEQETEYVEIARRRIAEIQSRPMLPIKDITHAVD